MGEGGEGKSERGRKRKRKENSQWLVGKDHGIHGSQHCKHPIDA